MTSPGVLLALFLCMAIVQISLQEKEDQSLLEKRNALLKFLDGLESTIKHQEQVKRDLELKKRRQDEIKRVTAELSELKQVEDEKVVKKSSKTAVIGDLDGGKRACGNRLSAGKCQILRWFGKRCTGKKMIMNCRATCGKC